ncbi:hypothetical protein HPB48_026152 [Haemaphysalis longicornis]|uniref:ATPase AAA-type core domain-containing protein n=1 Tax=Haemaphysalis longicornis TaxID=44386 RepID=A0A9J6H0E4_HAELO|nr:hypothetical protein HPB48_026152 [Haemaphysalis longicornis]
MEADERPMEQFRDIGSLDRPIQELVEAIILPYKHKTKITNLRTNNPEGVLLYEPPGTDKTFMARACAAQAKPRFLKLTGTQLVQMCIGH